MDKPIPLETILGEFDDDYEAWVLQDSASGLYVVVPDDRYPGRRPIRFFMKSDDAATLLAEIAKVNDRLRDRDIHPVKVNLKRAMRGIASPRRASWSRRGNSSRCSWSIAGRFVATTAASSAMPCAGPDAGRYAPSSATRRVGMCRRV